MGNGGAPLCTPEYFLDHDVVLVSGNYRLGALGFLSVGTEASPGNFGLKDQTLLLKWVHDNIGTFNGDVNRVTLFGESAGSGSVAFHLQSQLSHTLFHRAILQSGTNNAPWSFDYGNTNLENARKLGAIVGCELVGPRPKYDQFIDCLREKSWEDITNAAVKIFDFENDLTVSFLPVVEPQTSEAFVLKPPSDYVRYHGLEVPIMIGFTAQEGVIRTGGNGGPGPPFD